MLFSSEKLARADGGNRRGARDGRRSGPRFGALGALLLARTSEKGERGEREEPGSQDERTVVWFARAVFRRLSLLQWMRGLVPGHRAHVPLPALWRLAPSRPRRGGASRSRGPRLDEAIRRALPPECLAVRFGRLGQARVGHARGRRRSHRLDVRGRDESVLGRALRQDDRPQRPLGQALRQQPLGLVQGSRHDRARQRRAHGDPARAQGEGDRVRLDGRHQRVARRVRRRGGAAGRGAPSARQDFHGAARPAARARRARARARHGFRRLHGDRPAARRRGRRLPRELDEPAAPRGPEDGRGRDRAAVRLEGARLGDPAERQPRQRGRALRGFQADEGARRHHEVPAARGGAGREREPAVSRVECRQARGRADRRRSPRSRPRSRSATP